MEYREDIGCSQDENEEEIEEDYEDEMMEEEENPEELAGCENFN